MAVITEAELQEIVALANSVPEDYRQKCFELLLSHSMQGFGRAAPSPIPAAPAAMAEAPSNPFVIPIDVKALLNQFSLPEEALWKVFHVQGNDIRPIYRLKTDKKGRAQIEHALMMALGSALTSGQFQVMTDALRQRCMDE